MAGVNRVMARNCRQYSVPSTTRSARDRADTCRVCVSLAAVVVALKTQYVRDELSVSPSVLRCGALQEKIGLITYLPSVDVSYRARGLAPLEQEATAGTASVLLC